MLRETYSPKPRWITYSRICHLDFHTVTFLGAQEQVFSSLKSEYSDLKVLYHLLELQLLKYQFNMYFLSNFYSLSIRPLKSVSENHAP